METLIQIFGWLAFIAFCLLVVAGIFNHFDNWKEKKIRKNRTKYYKEVAGNITQASYWLNGEQRRCYRDLVYFIAGKLGEHESLSGEELRNAVDKLIKNETVTVSQNDCSYISNRSNETIKRNA